MRDIARRMWDKPPENPGLKIWVERPSAQSRTFLGPAPPVDPVSAIKNLIRDFPGQVGSATAAPADVRGPAKARTIGAREDVPPGFSRRSATRTMEPDSRDGGDLKPMTPIKNSIAGFTGITGMPIRMGAPTYRDRATALGCAEARSNAHLPRAGVPGAHNPGPRNRARETITRSYRLHIGVENRV